MLKIVNGKFGTAFFGKNVPLGVTICDFMKQVTLKISDNKFAFFMELVKQLGIEFVGEDFSVSEKQENEEKLSKQELEHINNAFKQVELIKTGKLKTRPVKELLG